MDRQAFDASILHSEKVLESATDKIQWKKPLPLDDPKAKFGNFRQRVVHYKAGVVAKPGYMPLSVALVMHESVSMTLPDGTKLYTDVFLPEGFNNLDDDYKKEERVPALVVW